MNLDYTTLDLLRQNHPAWRLLCSTNAPLVVSFLNRVYIEPNIRVIPQAELVEELEDDLFTLREQLGEDSFPKGSLDYLNDWADKSWLRKFYPVDSDDPHFDLTPATEKGIAWLGSLSERTFVGTESRLLTMFDLLKQLSEGSETDPKARIAELKKRRGEIDAEISNIKAGELTLLDETGVRDRFQQFTQLAKDLLTDFREVEDNFRILDRKVRERIALWQGGKGELLTEIMVQCDAITDSDQGRSFRSFWDFLMSQSRQEELSALLARVLNLPPVVEMRPSNRLKRVHYDWLEAGEHTQRTVAQLSRQLRRFLDDQAWLENRRIMDIIHNIEKKALKIEKAPATNDFMTIADTHVSIDLPMERPLFSPPIKTIIADLVLESGKANGDTRNLFSQTVIDKAKLKGHIRHELQEKKQISLQDLVRKHPLEHGLAELITYLQLASDRPKTVIDKKRHDYIIWIGEDGVQRQGKLPRIIFTRL
ncbi:MAG: DUF3375 domain-containing protein [Desulfobulbaceae bacterium]|jgi:hypothetical protein|nr:DUF3375 domain-containing protein [Desulfobulbaceae bacterium]